MIRVRILGSGTAIPSSRRGSPGLLLRADDTTLLVDCGPGSLRAAAAAGIGPADVDGVLLTHFHLDHCADLRALFFALLNPAFAGRSPLTVAGPKGLADLLARWNAAPDGPWQKPLAYELRVGEIGEGRHDVAGFSVDAFPVDHTPRSLAYRIRAAEDGPVVAVSGDTAPCDGVESAGRHADLFVLECSFPDGGLHGKHLTPTTAAEVAAAADPRYLVLTHFYPEVENEPIERIVSARWPGEVRLAADGMEFTVTKEETTLAP
ncbi:MAG: ribonuclease Z [Planctomycetota bacterium]